MSRRLLAACLCAVALSTSADEPGPVPPVEDIDPALAELGKRLFFDRRLSGDASLSCASCHQPDKGFTDGLELARAYTGSLHFRNTPTLIDTTHREAWLHDGRLGTSLNDVTREMLTETYLMNMDMRLMQERLKQDPVYVEMFASAGLGEPSNGGVRNAIPEYLKTLTSRGSAFDRGELSPAAERGLELFRGKGGCAECHSGPRFTDDMPHVTGVPENPAIWSDPLRHVTFVTYAKFMGVADYMNLRRDVGAHVRRHAADGSDVGSFMTPTLRELGHTVPYMHNGTLATLEEVVDFYDGGGGEADNKDPALQPLGLADDEKADLVAFLESLTGEPLTGEAFVWSEKWSGEYPVLENWRAIDN